MKKTVVYEFDIVSTDCSFLNDKMAQHLEECTKKHSSTPTNMKFCMDFHKLPYQGTLVITFEENIPE